MIEVINSNFGHEFGKVLRQVSLLSYDGNRHSYRV